MTRLLIIFGLVIILLAWCQDSGRASADHGVVKCGGQGQKACLDLVTPLLQQTIWASGELTWCLDANTSSYPQFRVQMQRVMDNYASTLGVMHHEVAFPTSQYDRSCHIKNEAMPSNGCSGCAAWIFTHNWPVIIQYKLSLNYVYWLTTDGHELGHGICLLDEHYDKVNFVSYIRTYGRFIHNEPTVMDFGTSGLTYRGVYYPQGIWELTQYDYERCKETLLPAQLRSYGVGRHADGISYIFYCDGDRRTTRVAILKEDFIFGRYWTGQYVEGSVAPQGQCDGQNITSVPVNPGDCFYLNQEISGWPASWERGDFRNDVKVGCF